MYEKPCENLSVFSCLTVIVNLAPATLLKLSVPFFTAIFYSAVLLLNTLEYPYNWWIKLELLGPFSVPPCGIFLDGFLWPLARLLPFKKKSSCSTNILRSSFYDSELVFLPGYLLLLFLSSPFFGGDLVF